MKNIFAYSLKIWLFTFVLASILSFVFFYFEIKQTIIWESSSVGIVFQIKLIDSIYRILFSIPFFLVFYLTNNFLEKESKTIQHLKQKINVFGMVLLFIPWFLFTNFLNFPNYFEHYFLFPILLTIGIWIFPIKELNPSSDILDDNFNLKR